MTTAVSSQKKPGPLCTGHELREMFCVATRWLEKNASAINALNVFPVPDGDTGTNMLLTMRSTMAEATRPADNVASDVAQAMAKEAAAELGITVVPVNIHFGLDAFMDGVDMQADEFYHRLVTGSVLPTTSAPSPGLFKDCYQKLAEESQEIISIHISSKLSGTNEAALTGKQEVGDRCRIEVINSQSATMGLGLIAIAAAKAANQGATIDEVLKLVEESINGVYVVAALDTLEFLQKGGRVGKAQAWLGSVLSIKPLISLRDGEVIPLERVRTHSKAIARVYQLLEEHVPAKELSVVYSTDPEEANKLVEHLNRLFPEQQVYLARFGPGLGTHLGPGTLAFAALK